MVVSETPVSADEILERVGFDIDELQHPVASITIELAARRADVPSTTVASAVDGASEFRAAGVRHTIARLRTKPGPETWSAFRQALLDGQSGLEAAFLVFRARVNELVADPALPYLFSAFDGLGDEGIDDSVRATLSDLADEFTPFLSAALATDGTTLSIQLIGHQRELLWLLVLADAYNQLLGIDDRATEENGGGRMIFDAVITRLVAEPAARVRAEPRPDPEHHCVGENHPLSRAFNAAANMLLANDVPLSTSQTVQDVCRRAGISSSVFYRCFDSIGDYHERSIERAGRALAAVYTDELFDEAFRVVSDANLDFAGSAMKVIEVMRSENELLADTGIPGRQLLPWLGSSLIRPHLRTVYVEPFWQRARFYQSFLDLHDCTLRPELEVFEVAARLNSLSSVYLMLTRVSSTDSDRLRLDFEDLVLDLALNGIADD